MKISRQIIIGFLFILMLFSGVLVVNYFQNKNIRDLSKWSAHSEEVLKNTAELQKSIVEVQSGMRGFLITNDDFFLEPYQRIKLSADSFLNLLKTEVADNPEQTAKLASVKDSFNSWIHSWSTAITNYREDCRENGKEMALENISKRMIKSRSKKIVALKGMVTDFENSEHNLQKSRQRELVVSRDLGDIISIGLLITSIIIGIVTLVIVSSNIRKRIASIGSATQKIANGDYSYRIDDSSNDELRELSESINKMTASLEHTINLLKQSNEDLEQFAWISSHDLKEPLRMVSIYSQVIASKYQGQVDQESEMAIKFIVEGVQKMYKLINSLLEYARIGRDKHVFIDLNTEELIESAKGNLSVMIQESKAQIIAENLPKHVSGVKILLIQALQNLIQNAIKFKGKEDPKIEIKAQPLGEKEYLFSIKDNGIGIDEKYKDIVFVIFQRLNNNEAYEGTGIGLANCKKIIELHGGHIWFESKPGDGTTFYFTLPLGSKE